MTVDLSEVMPVLAAAVVVGGGAAGGLAWVHRWMRREVRDKLREEMRRATTAAEMAAQRLATSNGHTTGELVEETHDRLGRLEQQAAANSTRLELLDARLDRHIVHGHGPQAG